MNMIIYLNIGCQVINASICILSAIVKLLVLFYNPCNNICNTVWTINFILFYLNFNHSKLTRLPHYLEMMQPILCGFYDAPGDDSLPGSVEQQRELADHLCGVLGGVVHGGHSSWLLGRSALLVQIRNSTFLLTLISFVTQVQDCKTKTCIVII